MSLVTLGLDGLYACGGMLLLTAVTVLVLHLQDSRDYRLALSRTPMDWTGTFIGPERAALPEWRTASPGAVPAELTPYVDYHRCEELHTAPIDYARAMKAAGIRAESDYLAKIAA